MAPTAKPGLRISEYVLEERIGAGAFGEVWRARHHVWDSVRTAIKIPTAPEYVRYLQREGAAVHGLKHANIVRVLGIDPYAEVPYLVMEYVAGPSLRQVIDQAPGGLPIPLATLLLRGVLSGIRVAHEAGILHRDLKPGNVLLNLGDRSLEQLQLEDVKLSDFGLGAGQIEGLRSIMQSASIDRDNHLVGTLAYLAPELRDQKSAATPRSDLYSIGVIFHELLTGQRPAGAELPSQMRDDVPPALDEVFRRLYARQDRRYESAQAALTDLDARIRPAPPPPPPRQAARQGPAPCPACGCMSGMDDQFCTQCGRQLVAAIRRCSSCGAFPGPRDRYCIFCRALLEG